MELLQYSLTGKRILVTGASSGIGRMCAVRAASLGAEVILNGRRKPALRETLQQMEYPEKHSLFPLDLAEVAEIESLVSFAGKDGKIDGLIHAAGVCPVLPLSMFDAASMEAAMRINCYAFFELLKYCTKRKFAGNGFSAVAVSSVSADAGWAGGSIYSASKGALSSAVRSLAMELAPKGYRVNAVCPSNIQTPMFQNITAVNDENAMNELLKRQPLGIGNPQQVADAVCFLLSEAAGFITGVNLPVDGGYLAQ